MAKQINNLWLFDRNKILILDALYNCEVNNSICGCDLAEMLEIPKNLLSYHIKLLREKGFICEEKCGQKKNYKIVQEKKPEVVKILQAVALSE